MGVELPSSAPSRRSPPARPGLAFTSSDLDDAYFKFAEVKELIRELAETENCIYRLAYAIKKAQKRANACRTSSYPVSIPRSPASPTRWRKRSARSSCGSRSSRRGSRKTMHDNTQGG